MFLHWSASFNLSRINTFQIYFGQLGYPTLRRKSQVSCKAFYCKQFGIVNRLVSTLKVVTIAALEYVYKLPAPLWNYGRQERFRHRNFLSKSGFKMSWMSSKLFQSRYLATKILFFHSTVSRKSIEATEEVVSN